MKTFVVCLIAAAVVAFAYAETECQKLRRQRLELENIGLLVPQCDENGDFEERQCHSNSKFCQCWTKDGHPISLPSSNLKTCKCHKHKHEAESKGLIGTYIPQCKSDGTYENKQCWGSTGQCWCADENGTKLTEPVRGEINC